MSVCPGSRVWPRSRGWTKENISRLAFEVESLLLAIGEGESAHELRGHDLRLGCEYGLTPREFHIFRVPMFLAGMPPCWVEASENLEGTLFPTPCGEIAYEGVPQRVWRGRIK